MSLWGQVRDGVLARTHELGRQVALGVVEALRRAVAGERRVFVLGPWPQIFEALGLRRPSAKAARAALAMLSRLTSAVVRVTAQTWRLASHHADLATAEQLELAWTGTNGKGESAPREPRPASKPSRPDPRTLARSLVLDLLFGLQPSPRSVAARDLADRVAELGVGAATWAVTITSADEGDAARAARAFVDALAGDGCGALLVPKVSGRLHHHGVAVGSEADVLRALDQSGAGHARITELEHPRRWAGYCWKAPAGDAIASGVLQPPAARSRATAALRSAAKAAWQWLKGRVRR